MTQMVQNKGVTSWSKWNRWKYEDLLGREVCMLSGKGCKWKRGDLMLGEMEP